jgi:hypothetical protein
MRSDGNETHVTETEASGGSKEGVLRWVLIIGTLLAVILLSAIWIFGAASQNEVESEVNVSDRIQAQDDAAGIDGVTMDDADKMEGTANDTAADSPLQTIEN